MTDIYSHSVTQTSEGSKISTLQGNDRQLLILGGSGFISGKICVLAKEYGFRVWILTRGKKPVPDDVVLLKADRNDSEEFSRAVAEAGVVWDVVIDCIGMHKKHAIQDIDIFNERARHLIFVSTDSVYDPAKREYPQLTEPAVYVTAGYGYNKRCCEEIIIESAPHTLPWTIVRPCHVYGSGAYLGCLPPAFRDPLLIKKIRHEKYISLAGGGLFLHQPIFVDDLTLLILSLANLPSSYGRIFNTPGGKIDTMRAYYEAIAAILGRVIKVKEISVDDYLTQHPEHSNAVCHRIYDKRALENIGAILPSTPLKEGLKTTLKALE